MRAEIRDTRALRAVSPAALSAWAKAAGWNRVESFGEHSDIYAASGKPEIILPRTHRLGDYASVVSRLIGIFAAVADRDELSLYRDLVIADRDVVRVRAAEGDSGSLALEAAVDLVQGARDLLLATACSLWGPPRPLYRASQDAMALLGKMRLGQTEQGSFVITVFTPPVPLRAHEIQHSISEDHPDDDPEPRFMTQRLAEALTAVQQATTRTAISGEESAFYETIEKGVSANLCEALVKLIEPFPSLDIGVGWARTNPMTAHRSHFEREDKDIILEAAQDLRARRPRPDTKLHGQVHRLIRKEEEDYRNIHLLTKIDGRRYSVAARLSPLDYEIAVQAHKDKSRMTLKGDLGRVGQRWHLHNARVVAPSLRK